MGNSNTSKRLTKTEEKNIIQNCLNMLKARIPNICPRAPKYPDRKVPIANIQLVKTLDQFKEEYKSPTVFS
jgi:hypothetical protein